MRYGSIVGFISTGAILAILIFLIVAFLIGYFSDGSESGRRCRIALAFEHRTALAGHHPGSYPGVCGHKHCFIERMGVSKDNQGFG